MLTAGIALLVLIGLILFGAPLFISAIVTIVFMLICGGYDGAFLLSYSYARVSSVVLMAFPLFTLAGGLMEKSGIADYLVNFISNIVSGIKGGLGAAGCIINAIFGACSASASAAITCIGPIMIPRLEKEGYPRPYATALMTASAGLAMIIPPSGHMIIYGWLTYTPVTALFLGGMLPGVAVAIIFAFINRRMVERFPMVKEAHPAGNVGKEHKISAMSLGKAFPALLFPVVILGSIYGGVCSPTEAAALAILYSVFVGFVIYRKMTLKGYAQAMFERGALVGTLLIVVFCTMMLARMFTMERIPETLSNAILGITTNKYLILVLLNVLFIILGMIMDDASAIIIGTALTFPLATQIGIHPVQFGTLVCINTAIGTFTPPVAPLLYLGQRVGDVSFPEIIKPTAMLLALGYVPITLLVTYWPPASLWLPTLVLGPKIMAVG